MTIGTNNCVKETYRNKFENFCAEIQTLRSFLQLNYFFSTYCLPNGSFSCIFSSTLTSNFAASLYLSTFLMTFKAMILSLKREKKIEIVIRMSCKQSAIYFQCLANTSHINIIHLWSLSPVSKEMKRRRALIQHKNLDFLFYLGWSGCFTQSKLIIMKVVQS